MTLWQDVRQAVRLMVKGRMLTASAVLTLAIGIGANTAIFAVINAVLLRPLPYPNSDRLMWVWDSNVSRALPRFESSVPNFLDWREQSRSFDEWAAITPTAYDLTRDSTLERIAAYEATPGLFPLLGVRAAMGRTFVDADASPEFPRVALISHEFSQHRFGSDSVAVGQTITLNGRPVVVVGVLPKDFNLVDLLKPGTSADVWTPLRQRQLLIFTVRGDGSHSSIRHESGGAQC